MSVSLEEKSKLLYDIVTNKFLNKAYLAQCLYKDKTVKQATSLFYQKLKGLSTMSDEDMFRLYEIVTNELQGLTIDLKGLAEEMNEKYQAYDINQYVKKMIGDKEVTEEMVNKIKLAIEDGLKKED